MYNTADKLQGLLERPDVNTICAYDYLKMKDYALLGEGLHINDYKPELRGVTHIPKMDSLLRE